MWKATVWVKTRKDGAIGKQEIIVEEELLDQFQQQLLLKLLNWLVHWCLKPGDHVIWLDMFGAIIPPPDSSLSNSGPDQPPDESSPLPTTACSMTIPFSGSSSRKTPTQTNLPGILPRS